jgi:hypothetical protein
VRNKGEELARLCRCAVRRPRRQLALAVVVSGWALAWILAQISGPTSPLDVLAAVSGWAGMPVAWLEAASDWAVERSAPFGAVAVGAGLCWAATTERAQFPALLGWLALLAAGEALGYRPAVYGALLGLGVFLLVLGLLSWPFRRAFVVDRVALMPKDVLRAGATAAALSAVVPLIAPGVVVGRLLRPYLTRPPRPDPTRRAMPVIPQARRPGTHATRAPERPTADR